MRFSAATLSMLSALLAATCWGCGPDGAFKTDLVPVKGKVMYKGKALTKGTIRFEPDGYGREARGQIQSDGTFVLTTDKSGDGAVPGHHRVSISGTGPAPRKELIPTKYTGVATSKLEAEVSSEKTEFEFDLK
jgi:hypothetical protein